MKVKIGVERDSDIRISEGTVTIIDDKLIIGVEETEKREEVKRICSYLWGDPELLIIRNDGWEISIGTQAYDNEDLVVTRFYRDQHGNPIWDTKQYLTKKNEWKKDPDSAGPLPKDAVRISLSALFSLEEKIKV